MRAVRRIEGDVSVLDRNNVDTTRSSRSSS
jgi:hypothetical protein